MTNSKKTMTKRSSKIEIESQTLNYIGPSVIEVIHLDRDINNLCFTVGSLSPISLFQTSVIASLHEE